MLCSLGLETDRPFILAGPREICSQSETDGPPAGSTFRLRLHARFSIEFDNHGVVLFFLHIELVRHLRYHAGSLEAFGMAVWHSDTIGKRGAMGTS